MILDITAVKFTNNFFDYIKFNTSYYINTIEKFKTDFRQEIENNPENLNHYDIMIYNRYVDGTCLYSASASYNRTDNRYTIKKWYEICSIIVDQARFFDFIEEETNLCKH